MKVYRHLRGRSRSHLTFILVSMRMLSLALLSAMVVASVSTFAEDGKEPKAVGPPALKISFGDVLIRIDGPLKWTMNRIEYKGTPLAVENSAYGTVFLFPGIGFI